MGPLQGIKVIEMVGLGPGPLCAMMLADMGAEVIRVDRPGGNMFSGAKADLLGRNRPSLAVDLKHPDGVATVLRLVEQADALLEGFRPGVMERLGLGPDTCLARNEKLVYGRMTGWGQDGPLAQAAGHDINYIALAGALHAIGEKGGKPIPPLNLVGDFGGGGMMLALGITAALLAARASGQGQVVDAAMTDGSALLMSMTYGMLGTGRWGNAREANLLDGAAPYYDIYACADGRFLAVGAIEPQFFAALIAGLGLDPTRCADRHDPARWPALKAELQAVFLTRPRDAWCSVFDGTDACVAPVLDLAKAPLHPHNRARDTFVERDGIAQPAPAPRFSATPATLGLPPPFAGEHTDAALRDWGFDDAELAALRHAGAIGRRGEDAG
jgi:alpha-methylacyl-CoA racemase